MKNNPIGKLLKLKQFCLVIIFSIFTASVITAQTNSYYQLKIYSIENESQEQRLDEYLKMAYLPALHRSGITKVGVFKPKAEEPSAGSIMYVFIPFKSLEQFIKLPEILSVDLLYQSAGKNYIDATFDNPPYRRIESILLKAFKNMPEPAVPMFQGPRVERVYELRSYEGATEKIFQNKVEMFNEGGETDLFKKLEFNPVFFGEVISGGSMPNLIYMTSFSNEASRNEHWKAFGSHPEWELMKENPKYQNNVSSINKILLQSTDYSHF